MIQYQSTPDYYRDYIEHGWFSDTAKKAHKYIKKYINSAGNTIYVYKKKAQESIDNYKKEKEIKDERKAKREWIEKGKKKVYKQRKSQIDQARANADRAYRKDPKKQYAVRKKQIKNSRKSTHDAYAEKKKQQHYDAFNSYYDRRENVSAGRKTAKSINDRVTRMTAAYRRRPGKGLKKK